MRFMPDNTFSHADKKSETHIAKGLKSSEDLTQVIVRVVN